jgi:C1A family cysteine protease
MAKSILLFAVLATLTTVFFVSEYTSTSSSEYDAFIAKYRRNYATVNEYEFRKQIFESNLAFIEEFNSQGKTWTLAVNNFADMTKEEVKRFMGFSNFKESGMKPLRTITAPKDTSVNDVEINWIDKGYVNAIKNQANCGSCWAFAANAGVESAWRRFKEIKGEKITPPNLSEQMLVDCDPYSAGCLGGFMNNAYYLYTNQCPVFEGDYPYTAKDGDCNVKGKACATDRLLGWYDLPAFDDEALRHALNLGPVPVAIQAENPKFYLYEGGIISGDECGYHLDHGVAIIGEHFETVKGETVKIWDVRNSWGETWGEKGYVRIQRSFAKDTRGNNVGVCGINQANSLPTYIDYYHN